MLKIVKVKGNIFDTEADVICNAVNCVGVMGAGIAKSFAERYPQMYKDYQQDCANKKVDIGIGHYYFLSGEPWKVIANVPTMYYPGSNSKLEDIAASLCDLIEYMHTNKLKTCVMPYLGCGVGRINSNDFEEFLENFTTSRDITIVLIKFNTEHF